jgi:hypothetical protein
MDHQREAGSDNLAARTTAQEILQRVLAAQQRNANPAPVGA